MIIEFSNGVTLRVSSMAQARRFLAAAAPGLRIVRVNGKEV